MKFKKNKTTVWEKEEAKATTVRCSYVRQVYLNDRLWDSNFILDLSET